ncbi:unnamed protein product [Symbiodinium microadriaticum]|nr:unnamed protein product [Symbiodinium microadriaticum]
MAASWQGRRHGGCLLLLASTLLVLAHRQLDFLSVSRPQLSPRLAPVNGRFVSGGATEAREPMVARGDGEVVENPIVIPTLLAIVGGLAVGVALARAIEVAGTASQERGNVSEGLKAQLSADAGMEDVEDDESDGRSELLESMKKAQGISEEEAHKYTDQVKKLKKAKVDDDDGWLHDSSAERSDREKFILFLQEKWQPKSGYNNDRLQKAKELLEIAFRQPSVVDVTGVNSIITALGHLEEIGQRTTRIMQAGYVKSLYDSAGELVYELSDSDQLAVQEYTLKYIFVLGDLLPLVLMQPEEIADVFAQERGHPLLRRRRILSTLRVSWWNMLVNNSTWAVPFFGGLAAVERALYAALPDYFEPYRDELLHQAAQSRRSQKVFGSSFRVQGEPVLSYTLSREETFRKACSWLVAADSKSTIEVAERHFRTFYEDSLNRVFQAAARWPVFAMLHRLALRPRLENDDHLLTEPAEEMSEENETLSPPRNEAAGDQRMPPAKALEFYRVYHVLTRLFDAMDVQWWVSHGTLIGALRDGGLSRHADDLEVDVPEIDVEKIQGTRMRAVLGRNGLELSYDPRGRCFKVWPTGSEKASEHDEVQLMDQTWWLPQQRVGTPALDIYVVQTPSDSGGERYYISNDQFHCNVRVCKRYWLNTELTSFYEVPFGQSRAKVPIGSANYLSRAYGDDWNVTVRPHRWEARHGNGFEPTDVSRLRRRAAEPFGPLPEPVWPL